MSLVLLPLSSAWSGDSAALQNATESVSPTQPGPDSYHVDVFLRDSSRLRQSVVAPEALAVRDVLRPVLNGVVDPKDVFDEVRDTLCSSFDGRIKETAVAPSYKAVWCPEIQNFKVVCCDLKIFEVHLDSVVSVHVETGTPLE